MARLDNLKKILRTSFVMAKADFFLRIEGNYLGALWYLLNPLIMFLVIILIRGQAISHNDIDNYPIYLIIGLTSFNFFKMSLANSIKAIRSNINYIQSTNNIKPEVLVISGFLQSIFSHLFEVFLMVIFLIYYRIDLLGLVIYLIIFLFFAIFILGLSFVFATIGMYIYDFSNIWSNFTQLLFFVTPIFYSLSKDGPLSIINQFNPLSYFLMMCRGALLKPSLLLPLEFIPMIIISCFTLFFGYLVFNKYKKTFSEL